MKTAIQLLKDLNAAQVKWGSAMLVVGFPRTTKIVVSYLPQVLRLLETLLQKGGIPVGMINLMETTHDGRFAYSVFEEQIGNGWAEPFMKAFVTKMVESRRGEVFSDSIGIDEFRSKVPTAQKSTAGEFTSEKENPRNLASDTSVPGEEGEGPVPLALRHRLNDDVTAKFKDSTEIITNLDAAHEKWGEATLIVGFPRKTCIVSSNSPDRLELLENLLEHGGIPVAMFSKLTGPNDVQHFFYGVFENEVTDGWVDSFMDAFVEKMADARPGEDVIESVGIDKFRILQ